MENAVKQAKTLAKRMTELENKSWKGEKLTDEEKIELDNLDTKVAEIANKNNVNFFQLRIKCDETN